MQDFINEWKSLDVKFDGILSGFIANSKQGSIISDFIDDFKTPETLVASSSRLYTSAYPREITFIGSKLPSICLKFKTSFSKRESFWL